MPKDAQQHFAHSLAVLVIMHHEEWIKTAALPQHGEDITRAGGIFASVDASAKLAKGLQDVDVVAAHKVLSQVDDGHHERLLKTKTADEFNNRKWRHSNAFLICSDGQFLLRLQPCGQRLPLHCHRTWLLPNKKIAFKWHDRLWVVQKNGVVFKAFNFAGNIFLIALISVVFFVVVPVGFGVPLRDDKQTSLPLNQPAVQPSPPSCRSSSGTWKALFFGQALSLNNPNRRHSGELQTRLTCKFMWIRRLQFRMITDCFGFFLVWSFHSNLMTSITVFFFLSTWLGHL